MIPEAAIEAAARTIEACQEMRVPLGQMARAALEAAAPHMLEACWDAAATAAIEREHTYGAAEKAKYDNPYRPTP